MSTTTAVSLPPELDRLRDACMATQDAITAAVAALRETHADDPYVADYLQGLRNMLEDDTECGDGTPGGIITWLKTATLIAAGYHLPSDDEYGGAGAVGDAEGRLARRRVMTQQELLRATGIGAGLAGSMALILILSAAMWGVRALVYPLLVMVGAVAAAACIFALWVWLKR